MQHLFSMHASAHSHNYRQAYVLLLLGFVFLTLAWLGMFHSFGKTYLAERMKTNVPYGSIAV